MFTIEQINAAHSKVKSGADFPTYIQDLKKMGVSYYETFVEDGHTEFYGDNNYHLASPPGFEPQMITATCNQERFIAGLKAHQQGKTDFPVFIAMCAEEGVKKWMARLGEMSCTYYDQLHNEILIERIPEPISIGKQ